MNYLYPFALTLFTIFSIPKFWVRLQQAPNAMQMIRERFGFFSKETLAFFNVQHTLWIHAVSVGEVMAAKTLITLFSEHHPDWKIALTTSTPTGFTVASNLASKRVGVLYAPMDFAFIIRRFLSVLRPKMILIMETEIWPNWIHESRIRNIPIGIINGRISERAMSRYRRIKSWTKSVLSELSFCLTQYNRDRDYFVELGMDPAKVEVMGNMKLDAIPGGKFEKLLLAQTGLTWIAGSTHWNEEEVIVRVYERLKVNFVDMRLVIAPRHPEHLGHVLKLLDSKGLIYQLYSQIHIHQDAPIIVVDRMGVLSSLYQSADVVFVGGSFTKRGGQNPVEAARWGKPVLHGPHVANFKDIYEALDGQGASYQVDSEDELFEQMQLLLKHQSKREKMGETALSVVASLRGATSRTLQFLEGLEPFSIREKKVLV